MWARGSGSVPMVSVSNHEDAGVVPGLVLRRAQDEASEGAVAGWGQRAAGAPSW